MFAILKSFGGEPAFSEIEFYKTTSCLTNIEFVLNENNRDNIYVSAGDPLILEKDIFFSARLPGPFELVLHGKLVE